MCAIKLDDSKNYVCCVGNLQCLRILKIGINTYNFIRVALVYQRCEIPTGHQEFTTVAFVYKS